MKTERNYRTNGAKGALLDEYKRALIDLKGVIGRVSAHQLATIVDTQTKDLDCRSIQTILSHVLEAGYNYVIEIRNSLGEQIEFNDAKTYETVDTYMAELDKMFAFNEQLFHDYPNLKLLEQIQDQKIRVRWGQTYDVEQLMEHAIVHILRHRRQIERFMIRLN